MLLNYHDVKSLLWILKYFTISFACWNNHDKTDSHIRFLYICLLCYYSFACACITHNSIHNRTFVNNVIEKVYLLILSISYGHPSLSLIPGHNIGHHKKTETRQDAMHTSKMRYKWNFLNLFLEAFPFDTFFSIGANGICQQVENDSPLLEHRSLSSPCRGTTTSGRARR